MVSDENFAPFLTVDFDEFFKDLESSVHLKNYLVRRDSESVREDLDKKFFESLNFWVDELDKVEFNNKGEEKNRSIISVINKFVFVQTLDDYEIIDFNWIMESWAHIEQRWKSKGPKEILKQFFREVNTWFYEYYDTELFTTQIIDYVKDDKENFVKLFDAMKFILGVKYYENPLGARKGIIQYNFKHINEDVFGKAYEEYLSRIRHDEAIYYTPHYVTEHIVETTVGHIFDQKIQDIKDSIEAKNFGTAEKFVEELQSLKILDPACGSGSFLVKSFKKILQRYVDLDSFLVSKYKELSPESESKMKSPEGYMKIDEFRNKLKTKKMRNLIPAILLRHIHGNDLDKSALSVAKVNLWLEGIKSAPSDFRYTELGESNRILPYLEMNLIFGNAVVGLDDDTVIHYMKTNKKQELQQLHDLRQKYLSEPTDPTLINEIENIQSQINNDLFKTFTKKIQELNLSETFTEKTIPLHWPVKLFHMYFDGVNEIPKDDRGAHCVVGNPPYLDSETMSKNFPEERIFCSKNFDSAFGNWDYFCVFIEKGLDLVRRTGKFGYIIPNKLLSIPYANETCNFLRKYTIDNLRDYTTVKVFDADVYPIVLTVSKIKADVNSPLQIEIMDEVEFDIPKISEQRSIKLGDLYSLENNLWASIFGTQEELDLTGKIYSKGKNISEINEYVINGAATVSEAYEIKKILHELKSDETNIKKFINTGTIDPFSSLWGVWNTQYIKDQYKNPIIHNTDLQSLYPTRFAESNLPKIIIGGMTKGIEAFYDSDGEYLAGKSTTIITSEKYSLKPLVAFFNSSLATFLAKNHKGMALAKGYLKIGPPLLKGFPIHPSLILDINSTNNLTDMVDELQLMGSGKNKFEQLWAKWCEKLSINEKDLFSSLDDDFTEISRGKNDETWFADVKFYPTKGRDQLSVAYDGYELDVNHSDLKLIIKNPAENMEIFYITFKDLETLTHVYLCLKQTIESVKQVPNLKELFEKTKIPIITPNYNKVSKIIIEKTIEEFKVIKSEKIPGNIIEIIERINELFANIDYIILLNYGINAEDAAIILESNEEITIHHKSTVLGRFTT